METHHKITKETLYSEKRFSHRDRIEVTYVCSGEGFPLVFLHGLDADHHQWNLNLPRLAEDFTVLALDFPGHGKTGQVPDYSYSIEDNAQVVVNLLKTVGVEPAVLVGNSMGGHVAMWLAVHQPELLEGLVLASPTGGEPFGWFEYLRSLLVARLLPFRYLPDNFVRNKVKKIIKRNRDHPLVEGYVRQLLDVKNDPDRCRMFRQADRKFVYSIMNSKLHRRVAEIEVPTLLVWGEDDPVVDVSWATKLHRKLSGSLLKVFPDTGHSPPLERPENFNRLTRDFVRGFVTGA